MKANELKRRAEILAEWERVDKFYVPQAFYVDLRRRSDRVTIQGCDNPVHGPELENLAYRCFAQRIRDGLTEYRAALAAIADVEQEATDAR